MTDTTEKLDKNLIQMLAATQSLHASHEITSELERSKRHAEQITDGLPSAFAIITETGEIFKANRSMAKHFSTDFEDMIGRNLEELFPKESWKIFKEKQKKLVNGSESLPNIEFELPIEMNGRNQIEFLWNVQLYSGVSGDFECLYEVMGQDISEIKEYETKLSQIFACIPLGILTIEKGCIVSGPYSSYVQHLLELNNVADRNLHEILFDRCAENLSVEQKEGAKQIDAVIGVDDFWFDSSKVFFPNEVKLNCGNNGDLDHRWIGISYHPIVIKDGTVFKLLIVLSDNTAIVHSRIELQNQKDKEDQSVRRIVEIQRCDPIILESTIEDLEEYKQRLERHLQSIAIEDIDTFIKALTGTRALARTAGFSRLKSMAHSTEERLKTKQDQGETLEKKWITSQIIPVITETDEVIQLYQAVCGKDSSTEVHLKEKVDIYADIVEKEGIATLDKLKKIATPDLASEIDTAIKALRDNCPTKFKLTDYESTLQARIRQTAKIVGKHVDIEFDWADVRIDHKDMVTFGEIALHILNNAVDHGIEKSELREKLGKPEKGKLSVTGQIADDGSIDLLFKDDGAGISTAQITESAIKKGLCTPEEISKLSEKDKLALIMKPGFSTTDKESDVSGGGVGLDAVVEAIRRLNGCTPEITTKKGEGTEFSFKIYVDGQRGEDFNKQSESTMDELFIRAFSDLCTVSHENASESVKRVLVMSSKFMSKASFEDLLTFRDLYTEDDSESRFDKDTVNKSVDNIFDQAMDLASQGDLSIEEMSEKIREDKSQEDVRLGVSGLQKKLETLISTEDLLKNKLAPVIKSMEFEKEARSRVQHVSSGIILLLNKDNDLNAQMQRLHNSMSPGNEKDTFEENVLERYRKGTADE